MLALIVGAIAIAIAVASQPAHGAAPPNLVQLAMGGDPEAQFRLGGLYARGEGVDQDHEVAVLWWRRAAAQGLADAQSELGTAYAEGRGVEQDPVQAVQWFAQAAAQGLAIAQSNLAIMYWSGEGVGRNDRRAVELFRASAEQGLGWAQFYLGEAYRAGRGIRRSNRLAAHWYRLAAAQGYSDAQFRLGELYRQNSADNPVIDSRVLEAYGEHWMALAARAGHLEAAVYLARRLRTGCPRTRQSVTGSVRSQPDGDSPVLRVATGQGPVCVLAAPGRTSRPLVGWSAILLLDGWSVGFVRNEDLSAR